MDKRTLYMGTLLLALVNVSCGSSGKPSNEDAGDSGLEDSGKPDAGKKTDASTTTTTTTMTALPVPCGTNMCAQPMSIAAGLGGMLGGAAGGAAGGLGGLGGAVPMAMACCLDPAAGMCGISSGGVCMKPAVPDMRCKGPDLGAFGALLGGGMAMPGCCTDSGDCGVDGSAFGNGCVEDAAAASMLSAIPLIGMLIMIPPPQRCDASGEDGGSMMSGGGGSGGSGGTGGTGEDAGH